MTWSKDNTISVLALFASCTPIFILIAAHLLRRRRMCAKKQRRYLRQWTATAIMLTEIARVDVERTPAAPQPQSSQYVWIKREYTLVALILVQRDARFADYGSWETTSGYGESGPSNTSLIPEKIHAGDDRNNACILAVSRLARPLVHLYPAAWAWLALWESGAAQRSASIQYQWTWRAHL